MCLIPAVQNRETLINCSILLKGSVALTSAPKGAIHQKLGHTREAFLSVSGCTKSNRGTDFT